MSSVKLYLDHYSEANISQLRQSILLEQKVRDRLRQIEKRSTAVAHGFFVAKGAQCSSVGEIKSRRMLFNL